MAGMAGDNDKPATKGDVREAIQRLEETMRAEIRELAVGMPRVMKAMIADETRNALAIQREEFQSWARAFDERSEARLRDVEGSLAEHKIDFALHKRPPSRKPASRKTSAGRAK
jgi:hypothetical protein